MPLYVSRKATIRNNTFIGTVGNSGSRNDSNIGVYLRILANAYIDNNLIYLLNMNRCGIRQRDENSIPYSIRNNAVFVGALEGEEYTTDYFGNVRTAPWSIGAVEYDQ